MDMLNPCCCCLLRLPVRDMKAPYVHHGLTEIYSNMIEECFAIELAPGTDECGICEECVGRLRDARDFKLQVQRSQAELQARLEDPNLFKVEDPSELVHEVGANEQFKIEEEFPANLELFYEDAPSDDDWLVPLYVEKVTPMDPSCDVVDLTSCDVVELTREQLAMACSVRLERLRDDKAPHACPTCQHTFDHEAILAAHMRDHEESGLLAISKNKNYFCESCRKAYPTKKALANHMRAHGCATYLCQLCPGKRFQNKHKLHLHKRYDHNIKSYTHKCKVCNTVFLTPESLKKHQDKHIVSPDEQHRSKNQPVARKEPVVSNEPVVSKLHTCDICELNFTSMYELFLHIRSHTGTKPFFCSICPKRFLHNIQLILHTRSQHVNILD